MSPHFLAALQKAPDPAVPELRDIIPPVDVFPWPWWQVALVIAAALALLALVGWLAIRAWPRGRPVPPLAPREAALRELERLRVQVRSLDPHAFSVAVSDVLRGYVAAQYRLPAREQTSPEFLDLVRGSAAFSDGERDLLARFLERCDLVKFARIGADEATSEALLESARSFVQGADPADSVIEKTSPPRTP